MLDTNIVSEAVKPEPSRSLLAWMGERQDDELFIAAITVGEIWRGILKLVPGRKRTELEGWFAGVDGPQALFAGRVLPFDEAAALSWARLMADGEGRGRTRSALDMVIAAVAEVNGCIVVTRNERDFAGLEVLNPFR